MKIHINNKKGVVFGGIGLLAFAGFIGCSLAFKPVNYETDALRIEANLQKNLSEKDITNQFLNEYDDTISFLANTFQIDKSVLVDHLKEDYIKQGMQNTDNTEKVLIDYLFDLEKKEKKLFSKKTKPCKDSKEYMVALIKHFTEIYTDVDFAVAAGIAEVESYYGASTMLKKNNIFGGMSKGKLIKYRNIEYGILKYIKLLNDGYYKKGLNTIEKIGRVYNPMINENGKKVAKPAWVKNVTKASLNYQEHDNVDIKTLSNLKKVD